MAQTTTGVSGATYELRGLTVWLVGSYGCEDIELTTVSDPEDFETAADNEDEDMRCMMADARREFGF